MSRPAYGKIPMRQGATPLGQISFQEADSTGRARMLILLKLSTLVTGAHNHAQSYPPKGKILPRRPCFCLLVLWYEPTPMVTWTYGLSMQKASLKWLILHQTLISARFLCWRQVSAGQGYKNMQNFSMEKWSRPVEGAGPLFVPKRIGHINDPCVDSMCSSKPCLNDFQGIDSSLSHSSRQGCHCETLT